MTEIPRFGQYAESPRTESCPRHPGQPAVAYCKRCNRPACVECAISTEVGSICVDCAKTSKRSLSLAGQPVVTYSFIALCVIAFGIDLLWPTLGNLLAFQPAAAYFQPWRFLTVVFVHGGFLHLFFNMVMLYFIGSAVERSSGHMRFLGLMVVSALGGSVLALGWTLVVPDTLSVVTVGASGALYGLFGAVFVGQKRSGISTRSIVILLGINLLFSFTAGGISWQAHIGGLIVGGLMTWIYFILGQPRRGITQRKQDIWSAVATAGVILVLALISYGIYYVHLLPA